eukprot:4824576-Amphidinium_carterae.1
MDKAAKVLHRCVARIRGWEVHQSRRTYTCLDSSIGTKTSKGTHLQAADSSTDPALVLGLQKLNHNNGAPYLLACVVCSPLIKDPSFAFAMTAHSTPASRAMEP